MGVDKFERPWLEVGDGVLVTVAKCECHCRLHDAPTIIFGRMREPKQGIVSHFKVGCTKNIQKE